MAKVIALAVDAKDIAIVAKRLGNDGDAMDHMIAGIGKQAKSLVNNITHVSTCVLVHAARNFTSKYVNALIEVLADAKRNDDAKALIAWYETHGFAKVKGPDKKYSLAFDKAKMEELKTKAEADQTQVITDLLSKPYHLGIAKSDPFKDYSLLTRLEAELKRAKKMKDAAEARDEAGVSTDVFGIAEGEAFIKALKDKRAQA